MEKESDVQLAYFLIFLGVIIAIIGIATYPTDVEQFFGADPTPNIMMIIAGVIFVVWGMSKYTESKKEPITSSMPQKTTSQGKTLESDQKDSLTQCPNCNAEIQAGWKACPSCGNKL